jgi:PAS domain S-box-containing protein
VARDHLRLLLVGVAYFCANKVALLFPDAERILAVVWPAAGIGLGALLLNPRRLWPRIALAIFLAGNLANLISGRPLLNSLGFMTANVLESLASAWLMTAACGELIRFNRVKAVGALAVVATLVNAATACIGAGTAKLAGISPFGSFWITWWVADGLGMLLVTPITVCFIEMLRSGFDWKPNRAAEHAAFFIIWCATVWWTFQPHPTPAFLAPKPYVLLAFILWPAFRLGRRAVSIALIALACIAVLSPAVRFGPLIWGGELLYERVLHLQVFLGFMTVASLMITAIIAEHRETEQALAMSEQHNRRIVETAAEGIWILDSTGQITYVNPTMAHLVGYAPEEIIGRPGLDFLFEEDRANFAASMLARESGKTCRHECRLRKKDGGEEWFLASTAPILAQDGSLVGSLGMFVDITARKAAEEALLEREANFRGFYESMTDMVWVVSPEGRVLLANDAASRILGYRMEEFRSMPLLGLHPPDRREEAAGIFAAMLRGERANCPLPLAARDGSLVPVDTRIWRGRWRNADCIFGISKDLSAEQEAQERFERMFHNNPAAMALTVLSDRQFVDVNEAFVATTGYSRQEIIGKTADEIGLFPDARIYQQSTAELLATGSISNFETLVRCKNGSQRHGVFSAEVVRGQRVSHVLSVMIDITERKQAEFALQVREERLRRTFDKAPVGIFQGDKDGRFQYVNQKMCDIVGYTRDELVGLSFRDISYPQDIEADQERLQALIAGQEGPVVSQKLYIRKDGSLVWGNRTVAPIQDSFGRMQYVIGIVEDITEKRQAELFREDVERIIRHDLKTPLSGVINIPHLLLDDDNLTAEQRSLLELVAASGRRMLHQINASLELYKIESGIYRFEACACDPARLVRENVSLLCTILDIGTERFLVRDSTSLGPGRELKTDPLLLDIVLMNLLRNAVEASDPGAPVAVDLRVDGGEYAIAITNSRPVPPEIRDRFFDKFVTAGKPGGTGLGTYSAALMVKAVGGAIAMETSEAKGTRVTVSLPLAA